LQDYGMTPWYPGKTATQISAENDSMRSALWWAACHHDVAVLLERLKKTPKPSKIFNGVLF
jgi:hypothetical protein